MQDGNPHSSNLFLYCNNNPVNFSDPTGHYMTPADRVLTLIASGKAYYDSFGKLHVPYSSYSLSATASNDHDLNRRPILAEVSFMRGLEFKYHKYDKFLLNKIFEFISVEKFRWYIPEKEIVINDLTNLEFPELISGNDFRNLINIPINLIVQANIQAFSEIGQIKNIIDYNDFLESECELIVMLVDCHYGEIYIKKPEYLLQFVQNLEKIGCEEIKIKTDSEDGRIKFTIS